MTGDRLLVLLCLAVQMWSTCGQDDIRLVNGAYGSHMGRVEVFYNNTWGTICDDFWSRSDGIVACKMLGFDGYVCSVYRAGFGRGVGQIWMDDLTCDGTEERLEDCPFRGWGRHTCSRFHSEDAGLVCNNQSFVAPLEDVKSLKITTRSLVIGWSSSPPPPGALSVRFRVEYEAPDISFSSRRYVYLTSTDIRNRRTDFNTTITRLKRSTSYTVRIRTEFRYRACYGFHVGSYSRNLTFTTASQVPTPTVPVRLVSPDPSVPFMGRVEVRYNGTWGTVCDDYFASDETGVVCSMLGYDQYICYVNRGRFGAGSGPIWMDNVDCNNGEERLEDCTFLGWGINNCNHRDDVGVICRPDNYPGQVSNFTVKRVGATSVTLSWEPVNLPTLANVRRYRITYRLGRFLRSLYPSSSTSEYTISRLEFGANYTFGIRAEVRFSYCYTYLYGLYSYTNATTMETPPTAPPSSFHVVVLNSTAVEAQWDLPLAIHRNGIIRGYRLFVGFPSASDIRVFDIKDNATISFIVHRLEPSTSYVFSVLAYTTGDGPRTIHLRAQTRDSDFVAYIVRFGVYGNGLDRVQAFTYRRGFNVHCGAAVANTNIGWYYTNGSRVGIERPDLREGYSSNGTALLEIGINRRLSLCDAGVYMCVAKSPSGGVHMRTFTLIINRAPPSPSAPYASSVGSSSIVLNWKEPLCDGGHRVESFTIQYGIGFSSSFTIRNIDGTQRNYTVTGLVASTTYTFKVQTVSVDYATSSFSRITQIRTLPPAPSEPRSVRARLVTPDTVEVSWTIPANPNGIITHFTVYLIPLSSLGGDRGKRQSVGSLPGVLSMVFPGSVSAGNVTVSNTKTTYQFQVTATIVTAGQPNEGTPSEITADSVVFVPEPGLPVPRQLRAITIGNSSITLEWLLPLPPYEPVSEFKVSYTGAVEWRSRDNRLIQFEERGETSTQFMSVNLIALSPNTEYRFAVSAITELGPGADSIIMATTKLSVGDKLAFFHIRLLGIEDCTEWHTSSDTLARINTIKLYLVTVLNSLCQCGLTAAHITDDEISCRNGLVEQISYRARIIGTSSYSAVGLVDILQDWISNGQASVNIGITRLDIDPSCPAFLESLSAPDCPGSGTRPPSVAPQTGDRVSAGEVGGIIVGVVIAVMLLVLIVLIAVFILRNKSISSVMRLPRITQGKKDDVTPFAELSEDGRSRDSGMFEVNTLPKKE